MSTAAALNPLFFGKRALIVEDQDLLRDCMAFELETLGFVVSTANEGQAGFDLLRKESFDVILSDIRMPRWDGKKFLDEARQTLAVATPFAFVSAYSDLSIREAFELGADGFLDKPFSLEGLLDILNVIMVPVDERWKLAPMRMPAACLQRNFLDLATAFTTRKLKLGKSGICVVLDERIPLLSTGDQLSFDFTFRSGPLKTLAGTGTVRWMEEDPAVGAGSLGLEFDYLNMSCREDVMKLLKLQKPKATIPLGF